MGAVQIFWQFYYSRFVFVPVLFVFFLGYLPGEAYGDLPFFFVLAIFYLAMGIVWMVLCMIYIKVGGGSVGGGGGGGGGWWWVVVVLVVLVVSDGAGGDRWWW